MEIYLQALIVSRFLLIKAQTQFKKLQFKASRPVIAAEQACTRAELT